MVLCVLFIRLVRLIGMCLYLLVFVCDNCVKLLVIVSVWWVSLLIFLNCCFVGVLFVWCFCVLIRMISDVSGVCMLCENSVSMLLCWCLSMLWCICVWCKVFSVWLMWVSLGLMLFGIVMGVVLLLLSVMIWWLSVLSGVDSSCCVLCVSDSRIVMLSVVVYVDIVILICVVFWFEMVWCCVVLIMWLCSCLYGLKYGMIVFEKLLVFIV